MKITDDSPFYRLLSTKYDCDRELEAIEILAANPEIALHEWPGPDSQGHPFVKGSTALHYAANDRKLELAKCLIEAGADVNASNANWYRSVLSWAANNARVEMIRYLLDQAASPQALDAMHAAAWGGSDCRAEQPQQYAESLSLLVAAGADINDRRHYKNRTPLAIALESGNQGAIDFLNSHQALNEGS